MVSQHEFWDLVLSILSSIALPWIVLLSEAVLLRLQSDIAIRQESSQDELAATCGELWGWFHTDKPYWSPTDLILGAHCGFMILPLRTIADKAALLVLAFISHFHNSFISTVSILAVSPAPYSKELEPSVALASLPSALILHPKPNEW